MSYMDMTAMNAALKELYDGQAVPNLVYKNNPFLALVKKTDDFGGKYKPYPVIIGASQGRSATFATAQANQSAAVIDSFLLTSVSDYSIATIDNKTMLASKTDKMAFLQGAKLVIDMAIRALTLSLSSSLFRSGTGTIGRLASSSGISTGVITLAAAADVVQFEINMVLRAATTDGGSPRAAKGYVIAVNRSGGTVTVSDVGLGGAAGTPSGWTDNDYLSVDGDRNAKVSGLAAWIPASAPGATSFFGVDRSVDTVRLGGVRYDGSAQPIEEALIDAASLVAREGGTPDCAFVNYASYSALEKSMGAKVQYIDLKGPGEIGFRGIRVNGPNGEIKVIPDRNQLPQVCKLLDMSTVTLECLGEAPMILKYGDGLEMLRVADADAGEVRTGYYAQLGINAPGWNAHVDLGA